MKLKLVISLLLMFFFFSCENEVKENIIEEPYINPGISCKVLDMSWTADKHKTYNLDGEIYNGVEIEFNYKDSSISLFSINNFGLDTSIIYAYLSFKTGLVSNNYKLGDNNIMLYIRKLAPNTSIIYNYLSTLDAYLDAKETGNFGGYFNISKIDFENKLISGNFEFNHSPHKNKINTFPSITVTNGSFVDINYREIR